MMRGVVTFNISYIDVQTMDQLLALDAKVFQPEHQIGYAATRERLLRNSETDIGLFDGDRLMGYISLYPIPEAIFRKIRTGDFDETEVERHTLPYQKPGFYDSYLCGMVVDKEHYPHLKAKHLFERLQQHLMRLRKKGIFIRRIIAHAVSIAGRKTLQRMNFREAKSNIFIYNCIKQGILLIKSSFDFLQQVFQIIMPKLVHV